MESHERVVTLYDEKDLALYDEKEARSHQEDLITNQQAAHLLGIAICTLNLHRAKGYVTPIPTIDNRVYYRRKDIEVYKIKRDQLKRLERKRESLGLL